MTYGHARVGVGDGFDGGIGSGDGFGVGLELGLGVGWGTPELAGTSGEPIRGTFGSPKAEDEKKCAVDAAKTQNTVTNNSGRFLFIT